jgi:hypothetical protein
MDWRLGAVARAVAVSEETVIGASNVVGVILRDGQFDGRETGAFPEGYSAIWCAGGACQWRPRRRPEIASGRWSTSPYLSHPGDAR